MEDGTRSLRRFLSLFYGLGERIYFFPMMSVAGAGRWTVAGDLPEFIAGIKVRGLSCPEPARKFVYSPVSTTLSSPRFDTQIAKLRELNEAGYDIYFVPNLLTSRRRLQCTILQIRTVVVESDKNSLDDQREVLRALRSQICAAVFTGNRSIHMYSLLTNPIGNPGWIPPSQWRMLSQIRRGSVPNPEFDAVADVWVDDLLARGFITDSHVTRDYARLLRVPGFLNNKTQKTAELIHLDRFGYFPNHRLHLTWEGGSAGTRSVDPVRRDLQNVMTDIPKRVEGGTSQATHGEPVEERKPGTTMVHHNGLISFLDDLRTYEHLRSSGIPERHVRRDLHKVMFTAARVFGWEESLLESEWRHIVGLAPHNIGCSEDEAVDDIVSHWRAARDGRFRIWLPDCSRLPSMDSVRRRAIKRALTAWGCPVPSAVAGIVCRALYPAIQNAAVPCAEGRVSLSSRVMRRACGHRNFDAAMAWLSAQNILRLTSRHYVVGKMSRLYFVSIPLVLWLLGFHTEHLSWEQTPNEERFDAAV